MGCTCVWVGWGGVDVHVWRPEVDIAFSVSLHLVLREGLPPNMELIDYDSLTSQQVLRICLSLLVCLFVCFVWILRIQAQVFSCFYCKHFTNQAISPAPKLCSFYRISFCLTTYQPSWHLMSGDRSVFSQWISLLLDS